MKSIKSIFTPLAVIAMTSLPFLTKAQDSYASTDKTVPTTTKTTTFTNNADEATYNLTDPKSVEPTVEWGDIGDALEASYEPNARTVGVYLHVEKDHKVSPEQWGQYFKKLFTAAKLPAKIIIDDTIDEGKNCVMSIYVDGVSYEGDMGNGTLSPKYMTENYKKIINDVIAMYNKANSDLVYSPNAP